MKYGRARKLYGRINSCVVVVGFLENVPFHYFIFPSYLYRRLKIYIGANIRGGRSSSLFIIFHFKTFVEAASSHCMRLGKMNSPEPNFAILTGLPGFNSQLARLLHSPFELNLKEVGKVLYTGLDEFSLLSSSIFSTAARRNRADADALKVIDSFL